MEQKPSDQDRKESGLARLAAAGVAVGGGIAAGLICRYFDSSAQDILNISSEVAVKLRHHSLMNMISGIWAGWGASCGYIAVCDMGREDRIDAFKDHTLNWISLASGLIGSYLI